MLSELADKLVGHLETLEGTGKIVRLDHAFFAFTADVIGRICGDHNEEHLDKDDFAADW